MPGPNDFHVTLVETQDAEGKPIKSPVLNPGLGKDEPTDAQRARARRAGLEEVEKLKAQVLADGEALDDAKRALLRQQQELEERERQLAAREEAFRRAVEAAERESGGE